MKYLAEHSWHETHEEVNAQTQQMGIRIQQRSLLLWWAPQSNRVHTLITQKKDTSILLISETEHMHRAHAQNSLHTLLSLIKMNEYYLLRLLLIQGGSIYK